jgi:hypothetical protein
MGIELEAAMLGQGRSLADQAWLDAAPGIDDYRGFLATLRAALGDPVEPTPGGYRPSRRELHVIEREVLSHLAVRRPAQPLGDEDRPQ